MPKENQPLAVLRLGKEGSKEIDLGETEEKIASE